jgi:hypothetical protein
MCPEYLKAENIQADDLVLIWVPPGHRFFGSINEVTGNEMRSDVKDLLESCLPYRPVLARVVQISAQDVELDYPRTPDAPLERCPIKNGFLLFATVVYKEPLYGSGYIVKTIDPVVTAAARKNLDPLLSANRQHALDMTRELGHTLTYAELRVIAARGLQLELEDSTLNATGDAKLFPLSQSLWHGFQLQVEAPFSEAQYDAADSKGDSKRKRVSRDLAAAPDEAKEVDGPPPAKRSRVDAGAGQTYIDLTGDSDEEKKGQDRDSGDDGDSEEKRSGEDSPIMGALLDLHNAGSHQEVAGDTPPEDVGPGLEPDEDAMHAPQDLIIVAETDSDSDGSPDLPLAPLPRLPFIYNSELESEYEDYPDAYELDEDPPEVKQPAVADPASDSPPPLSPGSVPAGEIAEEKKSLSEHGQRIQKDMELLRELTLAETEMTAAIDSKQGMTAAQCAAYTTTLRGVVTQFQTRLTNIMQQISQIHASHRDNDDDNKTAAESSVTTGRAPRMSCAGRVRRLTEEELRRLDAYQPYELGGDEMTIDEYFVERSGPHITNYTRGPNTTGE